jgi:hypothetical protein
VLREWRAVDAQVVAPAGLILGFGYDDVQLKELRHPARDDLDAVSRDLQILVLHQTGHLGTMNSRASAASRPLPAGGRPASAGRARAMAAGRSPP